jgi:hypothetical protein
MDDQGEVVIRDEAGTEHVFPSGFDPKRAAQIVRQQSSGVPPASAVDMLSHRGVGLTSMDPAAEKPTGFLADLVRMMEPAAHPTTVSDFARLVLPSVGAGAAPAMIRGYLRAGKQAVAEAPNLRSVPKFMLKSLYQAATDPQQPGVRAFNELPLAKQMDAFPDRPAPVGPPPQPPLRLVPPRVPDAALSDTDFAAREVAAGRLDPNAAARIVEQRPSGLSPSAPRLRVDQGSVPNRTSGSSALAPEPVPMPSGPPLGQPGVLGYKTYTDNLTKATSTPWAPSSQFGPNGSNWASGLEAGSPEAAQAAGLHRTLGEMDNRLKFLMDNPNAAVALGLSPALIRQAILSRLTSGTTDTSPRQ